eukprot:NODE_10566_length_302_cov_200.222672.p3 GENE.NODE_10566_length_302_cov_200.222672~~NODE_10566_length_302_cov_200.222672.p3  ORF type:complete len:52 (+),score=2.40 NODE_10566_length_302_cov_200.222672:144-299(+)
MLRRSGMARHAREAAAASTCRRRHLGGLQLAFERALRSDRCARRAHHTSPA